MSYQLHEVVDTTGKPLEAGNWYALGFMNDDCQIERGSAPLYHYDGAGCWSDDNGEPVESLWDPLLQMRVAMDAADGYARQL